MQYIFTNLNKLFVKILVLFLIWNFGTISNAQTITKTHDSMSGELGFPGYSVDTGWLGADVGIGIYFRFSTSVSGTLAKVNQNGSVALTKNGPERNWDLYFKGSTGNASMNFGFKASAQYKISIDVIGISGEYIGDLPILPNTDLTFVDNQNFNSYLLGSSINLHGAISNRDIINYSFGIDGVLDAHAGFTATGDAYETLNGKSISTDKGTFISENEKKTKTINSSSYQVNDINEKMHSSLNFSLTPKGKIGVTVLFTDYDVSIPLFNVASPVAPSDFTTSPNVSASLTVPKLNQPVLLSPLNNQYKIILNPQLKWQAVNGADFYTLSISTDSNFASPRVITNITNTDAVVSGLTNNTTYFWKVKANSNKVNASDYSSVFKFTTKLATPKLYYPTDDTMGIELNPKFTWSSIPGSDNYLLEINTKSDFSERVIFDSLVADTIKNVKLDFSKNYYWRITALNHYGNKSDVSAIFNFSTRTPQNTVASWPSGGTTVYTLNAILSWYMDNYEGLPFTYDIQYSTDSTFKSNVSFIKNVKNTFLTSSLSNGNLHYFWRVRAKNKFGFYSAWDRADFVTDSSLLGAPLPALSWPVKNTKVYTNSPLLSWYINYPSVGGNLFYELKFRDLTIASTDSLVDSIKTTSFRLKNLIAGHQYSWSVRSVNTNNKSNFTQPETFVVDEGQGGAPMPVQTWPADSITIYSNTPVLNWYLSKPAIGPITYKIKLFDVTSGNSIIIDTANIISTSFKVPKFLSGNHTYAWEVETVNGSAQSGFSKLEYFVIHGQNTTPECILSWPIGGVKLFSQNVILTWYLNKPTANDINFDVELKDSATGETFNYNSIKATSFTLNDLSAGHLYLWKVRAHNISTGNNSSYTDYGTFRISNYLVGNPTPIASWPDNFTTVYSLKPLLSWYLSGLPQGSISYNLEIKPTTEPFDSTNLITGITQLSYSLVSDLNPGTEYHWRVQLVSSSKGTSLWSDQNVNGGATFTSYAPTGSLASPIIGSPKYGSEIDVESPTLSWYVPTDKSKTQNYRVEISKKADMSNPIIEIDNLKESHTDLSKLNTSTYFWRVQAKDDSGKFSNYSTTASFKVEAVTNANEENKVIPSKFEVLQNYPNPFNPTTTIKYSLPSSSKVTIKIYNVLGQEVKTLVNNFQAAGNHRVTWNGDDNLGKRVSSGAYIYRVTAGSNMSTKKLILLK